MDHLWTPWRYSYITGTEKDAAPGRRKGVPPALDAWPDDLGCIFCNMITSVNHAITDGMASEVAEKAAHVVLRGQHCWVCLNAYPYNSGHVLILPYQHLDRLAELPVPAAEEMMHLAQRLETAFHAAYKAAGINFGINIGQAAGAGVAAHVHMHALPRWIGDANFMTTTAETRVLPESLDDTWTHLRTALQKK